MIDMEKSPTKTGDFPSLSQHSFSNINENTGRSSNNRRESNFSFVKISEDHGAAPLDGNLDLQQKVVVEATVVEGAGITEISMSFRENEIEVHQGNDESSVIEKLNEMTLQENDYIAQPMS